MDEKIMVSEDAYQQVVAFRKDYDKLMDAVHYLSIMLGGPEEADALARLKVVYQANQDKWGG
jgi:hypothetical protein